MHLNRKLARNSLIGRIYFWFWDEVASEPWKVPAKEDTCGVRKILLLAIPSGFFAYRIRNTFLRPWMIVALAAFVWTSWAFRDTVAFVVVALAMVVAFLAAVCIAARLFILCLAGLGFPLGWVARFLERHFGRTLSALRRTWRRAGEWFWTKELIMGWPSYPWVFATLTLQAIAGILVLTGIAAGTVKLAFAVFFWFVAGCETAFLLFAGAVTVHDWAEEKELGKKISKPFSDASTAVRTSKPVQGSGQILRMLWKSLKDKVCIPVEWI